jgi:hypothetical protein
LACTKELAGIGFDNLVKEVQALESDHAQTVARLAELEKQRKDLGFWGGVTGRKRKYESRLASDRSHLAAVGGGTPGQHAPTEVRTVTIM